MSNFGRLCLLGEGFGWVKKFSGEKKSRAASSGFIISCASSGLCSKGL
jgi:hypothetical protein